jgi:FAD:protein FMN transferase
MLMSFFKPVLARATRSHPERPQQFAFYHERVLGASLELQLVAHTHAAAEAAEAAALAEIDRLATILSAHTSSSELAAWQGAPRQMLPVSPDLLTVLHAAESWRARTGGAFNPAAVSLAALLWDESPTDTPLAQREERLRALTGPLWDTDQPLGVALRRTELDSSLDAIAKGYIVEQAAARACRIDGVTELLLNIGGDLRHIGDRPVPVHITNPFESAENAPPLAIVYVRNAALTTSGGYRRGFTVNGQHVSHLRNPRTGSPVEQIASASVFAPDCATADALSTAFSVMSPEESVALADSMPHVGCLLVDREGAIVSNTRWDEATHLPEALTQQPEH